VIVTSEQIKIILKTNNINLSEKDIDYYIQKYYPDVKKTNLYIDLTEDQYRDLITKLIRKSSLENYKSKEE